MDKIEKILSEIERRKKSLRAGICNDQAFTRKQKNEMLVASEELSRLKRFIDSIPDEQISDDLEGAARLYAIPHYMKDIDMHYIEEYPYDPGLEVAFKAGAEWQKEQMMKEAVEGYVNYYEDSGGILMAEAQVGCPYHNGDKVKIIIVKEEDK